MPANSRKTPDAAKLRQAAIAMEKKLALLMDASPDLEKAQLDFCRLFFKSGYKDQASLEKAVRKALDDWKKKGGLANMSDQILRRHCGFIASISSARS